MPTPIIPKRTLRTGFIPRSEYLIARQTVPTIPPDAPKTPQILAEKYVFIKEVGHGAQGHVYLAYRLPDYIHVVVKQLNIESVKNWKEYDLFHREAKVLSSLDCQGIAKFYEAIESLDTDPPQSFIVQEFIQGSSLQKLIGNGQRFKVTDIYDIIIQVLHILQALQTHNPPIVHRDIKPSNLMMTPGMGGKFIVTLIDFGAVANPQVQGGGSTVAGTYGFMPPEQLMGKPTPASDIYALAAVAVQLFSGKSPADLPFKDFHLIFEPEMQSYSPILNTTLRRMLDPDIEKRATNIQELISIFQGLSDESLLSQTEQSIHAIDAAIIGNCQGKPYFEQLQKVESINQSGNINLWQALPDNTPRIINETQFESLYKKNRSYIRDDYIFKQSISGIKKTSGIKLFITGVILACLVLAIIASSYNIYNYEEIHYTIVHYGYEPFYFPYEMIFILAIPPILGLLYLFFKLLYRVLQRALPFEFNSWPSMDEMMRSQITNNSEFLLKNGQKNIAYVVDEIIRSEMTQKPVFLLKNGRKSIATIVKIKYIQTPSENIEENSSYIPYTYTPSYGCHGEPRFKVYYRFNPPDDMRQEDLIHEYVTSIPPENHYNVGDPLPILYVIDRNSFNDFVYSMPYPFPVEEYHNSNLVYFSFSDPVREEFGILLSASTYLTLIRNITIKNIEKQAKAIENLPDVSSRTRYHLAIILYIKHIIFHTEDEVIYNSCITALKKIANGTFLINDEKDTPTTFHPQEQINEDMNRNKEMAIQLLDLVERTGFSFK